MAIPAGSRIGAYAIAEVIGKGGMGEVYRATDTTLDREVAVKVLPASFAADADRIARFEQGAKLLASLNHPNIAQVFGLEKSAATTAIVMELVDGPTSSKPAPCSKRTTTKRPASTYPRASLPTVTGSRTRRPTERRCAGFRRPAAAGCR